MIHIFTLDRKTDKNRAVSSPQEEPTKDHYSQSKNIYRTLSSGEKRIRHEATHDKTRLVAIPVEFPYKPRLILMAGHGSRVQLQPILLSNSGHGFFATFPNNMDFFVHILQFSRELSYLYTVFLISFDFEVGTDRTVHTLH